MCKKGLSKRHKLFEKSKISVQRPEISIGPKKSAPIYLYYLLVFPCVAHKPFINDSFLFRITSRMWISDNVVSIACIACQVPEHKSQFPSLDLLYLAEFKHVFEYKTFISFS